MASLPPNFPLDRAHLGEKDLVKCAAAGAEMHMPVTSWAQGYHESGMIRAAVAAAMDMVGLKVWRAIRAFERSRGHAALTNSICPSKDIVAHVTRSIIDCARGLPVWAADLSGIESSFAKLIDIALVRWRISLIHRLGDVFNGPKLEDDGLPLVPVSVVCRFPVPPLADHFAVEEQASIRLHTKQKKVLAVESVSGDCLVSKSYLHVANLAAAEILDKAAVIEAVTIAVLFPGLAGKCENDTVVARRDYSVSLLASKRNVDVLLPRICAAFLKSPRHRIPQSIGSAEVTRLVGERQIEVAA